MLSAFLKGMHALIVLMFILALPSAAWADFPEVSPTRLVLEEADSAEVRIFNTTPCRTQYSADLIDQGVDRFGAVTETKSVLGPNEILFSPKHFSLEPGQAQTVRVLRRQNPASIELRTHLRISSSQACTAREGEFTWATTIPVVIRYGRLVGRLSLRELALTSEAGNCFVDAMLVRAGGRSFHGRLEVFHAARFAGRTPPISLFLPSTGRSVRVPLSVCPSSSDDVNLRFVDLEKHEVIELGVPVQSTPARLKLTLTNQNKI